MEKLNTQDCKIAYRLNDSGYTIYHRAALGGLAATIRSWQSQPNGLLCQVFPDRVEIEWNESIAPKEAIRRLLSASFSLSEDGLIDLPGQKIDGARMDLHVSIHNALCQTFLQHHKSRPSEKQPKFFTLKSADDDVEHVFTYKAVQRYSHQTAQGTGLFDDEKIQVLPDLASINQATIPGAFSGASALNAPSKEVVLLQFLMVSSIVFQLRPRSQQTKAQYCLVVPDVIDLKRFATALQLLSGKTHLFKSSSLRGRVVGGAEEAALRFLLDFRIAEEFDGMSVRGCQAIAMGKVAWDANQVNRSMSINVGTDYSEIEVFRAANSFLGDTKIFKTKKGEGYVVPSSYVPELVACNLANGYHWCRNFSSLMVTQDDARKLTYSDAREGLVAMKTAIKDEVDVAIIDAFQEAWYRTMRLLAERSRREKLDGERLIEVEREKVRNSILRTKTSDMLTSWFLRFCANATEGGSLRAISSDANKIRGFIFEPRNFERFQNLCLFALVSYEKRSKKTTSEESKQ